MKIRIDYLPIINRPYKQMKEGYHFNSDTVLLGLFLPMLKTKSVLDIGTHAGALLMYAKSKGAKSLVGIDILDEVLTVAKENVKEASFYCCDLKEFKHQEFDTIIVNPPFYPYSERNNIYLDKALNKDNLSLDLLFKKSRSLLKSNGSLYLIYPANCLNDLLNVAYTNDFSLHKGQFVYDINKEEAIRFLAEFKRGKHSSSVMQKPIYIEKGKIKLSK